MRKLWDQNFEKVVKNFVNIEKFLNLEKIATARRENCEEIEIARKFGKSCNCEKIVRD